MAEYVLNGLLLNGKAWLVDTSTTVTQPSQISVAQITAPAANTAFSVHGSYANFTMNGLQYSSNSTNGTDGNWSNAVVSLGSGTYVFTANGLPAGTYSIWVRRTDATGVFAQSNSFTIAVAGAGGTLTQISTVIDPNRVFSRDVTTGNPTGFTTTYNKGYAAVPFTLNSTTAGSLYIALYDANSSGATATAGSGTQLQAPVAVASASVGTQTITLNIPAGPKMYYADFALDAGMTSALRIPNAFGVGHVTLATGQSLVTGWFEIYPFYGWGQADDLSQITQFHPENVVYAPSDIYYGGGGPPPGAVGTDPWVMPNSWDHGNSATTGHVTSFAPEYLRLVTAKFGVVAALSGFGHNGAWVNLWDPYQWNGFNAGPDWDGITAILPHLGYKWDHFMWCEGNSPPSTLFTPNEFAGRFSDILTALQALAQKSYTVTASSANLLGAAALTTDQGIQKELALRSNVDWFSQIDNAYSYNDHPTMIGHLYAARAYYRSLLRLTGQGTAGPSLTGVAQRDAGSKNIVLTVQHDTGTALVAHTYIETGYSTYTETNTATSKALAQYFNVYPAGSTDPATILALDAVTPCSILSGTQVQLRLATAPADTAAFDVWYGYPATAPNLTDGVGTIRDNVTDSDGITYGRMLQMRTSPVYVPPPTVVTRTITVTSANGDTGFKTASAAITRIAGTFAGVPPTGVEIALNGGSYVTGANFKVINSGIWSVTITAPTTADYSLTARILGTSIVSSSVTLHVLDTDLPLTGAKLDLDPRRLSTLFSDNARTTQAVHGNRVLSVADSTGTGNHLVAPKMGLRLQHDALGSFPGLQSSTVGWDSRYSPPLNACGGLDTISGATLPTALRGVSFTLFVVVRAQEPGSSGATFAAETNFNATASPQTLVLMQGTGGALAERNATDTTTLSVTDSENAQVKTRIYVVRFDVSSGTLKLMHAGGTEVTQTTAADYSIGTAWSACRIGYAQASFKTGAGSTFCGMIYRLAVFPNHYATDSERDALFAYGNRVYI